MKQLKSRCRFCPGVNLLPRPVLYLIYALMVVIGFVAIYSLLNTGHPDSLLRTFFPDPQDDFYVAIVSSVLVFILGFFVFYSKDSEGFEHLLQMNAQQIRKSRKKGMSDAKIADSILSAMGSVSGYRHRLSRKKLIIYLSQFK